jgi:hypothetical protein
VFVFVMVGESGDAMNMLNNNNNNARSKERRKRRTLEKITPLISRAKNLQT